MKVAPLYKALKKYDKDIKHLICHTGQHYDKEMSKIFFDELELPRPDYYLGIGSETHAIQTAKIMIEFEKILLKEKPDLIIVVGDVNSTIACSLVASKLSVKVAHVEAGLRSFDRSMPEEINRVLTDVISDYLFVTEKSGLDNLKNEGINPEKIFFVGNVMIDSMVFYKPKIFKSDILSKFNLRKNNYVLVTFHRPANVDKEKYLSKLISFLNNIAGLRKIIFPIHPRTKNNLEKYDLLRNVNSNVILTPPIGYIDFQCLTQNAELVITDSGGIQEETTFAGIQCITVRDNTERPSTVDIGTNQLIGTDLKKVEFVAKEVLSGNIKKGGIPKFWDGKTAERISKILAKKLFVL